MQMPSGRYRVYHREEHRETQCEELTITIDNDRVVVHSPEWESIGIITNGRLVARFNNFEGSTSNHRGVHDLTWNGAEFVGSRQFDNGKWETRNLIWRPTGA